MENEERIEALEADVKDINTAFLYMTIWSAIIYAVAVIGIYV